MQDTFNTPQETVALRTPSLQLRTYGCDIAERPVPLTKVAPWHAALFMRKGHWVRTVRGHRVLVDRTHVAFINRGQEYTVWHPDEGGDAVTEFEVLPEVLAEIVAAHDPAATDPLEHPFPDIGCPADGAAYQTHCEIVRAAHAPATVDSLAIEETALSLIGHVVRSAVARRSAREAGHGTRRDATVRAHRDLAHAARLVLSARFRERLDLAALARAVHSSPYHLSRVFRAEMGSTVHRCLTTYRLHAALTPLLDGETPLARLALDLGFANQSHFTRSFQAVFGRTPGAVRRTASLEALQRMSTILQDSTAA